MRCWGDSNPWVATEDVMNTDLKHEKVRMRVKSTQEAQSKPVQKQTVQKVQVDIAPQMNKVSRVSRQEHILELARKMDKAEWEKERELVRNSAIARSSMLLADAGLQVGLHQELQLVPSISSEKQHFLGENVGRTQWIDRSAVDVQMQELPVNPTFSLSMPDVDKIVRVDEDSGHKFPAAKGFDSFSTSHPSNQSLSADLIFSDPQPSELVRDTRDSPAYGDNMHHSNDSYDHTGLGKRTFETAFSADTIHESDADAQSLSYPLPTAELLRAKTSIEHENIEEDLSLRPFESEETPESTSGDPLNTSLAKLKETFIDVVRQLQADKADLVAELEASKMYSKRLEESEARCRQENFQLNAEKRQLEESLKQSLLKGAEADERLRFVHWIVEETRRNRQVPNA
ncbi:uncharacterized protein EV420DRAFT_1161221 [Desarmillaria tabescens]|uniref:Uncharacterized protein n=1 Tax=Armillaria tabescens TaxID=1929756 RepID=A0AA39NCQ4_ARMTA|nr:uncharacterized protein EV420DRAFT_1161221 [Desarmillaria tabescens]KAK0463217.1 hypothetical protein EV420DRAFT_1161221 [Desarmillaria tabescens]